MERSKAGVPVGGVLFDMDGVVVEQRLDFLAIKQEIFGTTHGFILERMAELSLPERTRAEAILERHAAGVPNCVVEVNHPRGGLVLLPPGRAEPTVLYEPGV